VVSAENSLCMICLTMHKFLYCNQCLSETLVFLQWPSFLKNLLSHGYSPLHDRKFIAIQIIGSCLKFSHWPAKTPFCTTLCLFFEPSASGGCLSKNASIGTKMLFFRLQQKTLDNFVQTRCRSPYALSTLPTGTQNL
jgi:hypothetical protein